MRSVICAITSPTQTTMPRPPRPLVRSARWAGRFAASKRTCLQGSHAWQKQGSVFASPDGTTTWLHAMGCVYHMVCPKFVSDVTRWVYGRNTQKRRDLEARPQPAPAPKTSREASECLMPYRLVTVRAPADTKRSTAITAARPRACQSRRPSCIPSQVSASSRRPSTAGSPSRPRSSFARSPAPRAPARVPPSPWAARITVKSASLSGRRSRQGDLSRASELQLGELGLRLVPCPMVSPSEDCGLDNFFQVWRVDQPPHQADWPPADGWLKVRMSTRSPAIRATSGIAGPS